MNEKAIAMTASDSSPPLRAAARTKLAVMAGALAALMVAASVLAVAIRPKVRAPGQAPSIVLEAVIPKQFGDWREVSQAALVINPQTQELLDKLYSQTLSRTYVNGKGYIVMLSLAYGDDQRGGLQAHMPEVCYPAQGFKVQSVADRTIDTRWGAIPGKRVVASLGARSEPITYWFAMGDRAVRSTWEKRVVEVRFGLTGQVPEGLLFRVSSIDPDPVQAYRFQDLFVDQLLAAVPLDERRNAGGLGSSRRRLSLRIYRANHSQCVTIRRST